MRQVNSLNHTRWECKYHIVFIPKYRKKVIFGEIRRELGEVFHNLARQRESLIEEGHLMPDDDIDPTEVCSIAGGRIHKGKECDPHCEEIFRPTRELCRATFLGEGIFRFNGGSG